MLYSQNRNKIKFKGPVITLHFINIALLLRSAYDTPTNKFIFGFPISVSKITPLSGYD